MNWRYIKGRLRLIDPAGLDAQTVTTLRLMIASVAFGIVWTNVTTGIAMTGYMKELGATDFLYGLVIALPNIANAFQFICSYLLERTHKPRAMMIASGLVQRLIWIPFALIPYLIPMGGGQLRVWAAVVMALVSSAMAPFMNVAFYTIATDAVPMRIRGRYFATRSRVSTLVGLIIGLLIGVLLDRLPGFTGYAVVFILAGVFGSIDILLYCFMHPKPMAQAARKSGLLRMMRAVLGDRDYMKTVLAITAWLFCVQLSSPYFNVYVRQVLGLSNFNIILTGQVTSNLFLILFVSRWGAAIDRFGNKPVFIVAAFLSAITPLWWLRVGGSMLMLIAFANAWSGGAYCAVDLTMQNLFMGQARAENRSMYFAVYFLFTQLGGLALGSTVGGCLLDSVLYRVDDLHLLWWGIPFTRYNALFLLSALMRMAVVIWLLPRVTEDKCENVSALVSAMGSGVRRGACAVRAGIKRRRAHKLLNKHRADGKGL